VLEPGETACVPEVPSRVVSEEQLTFPPEYHWNEYGAVPPDGLPIREMPWPVSIFGEAGVMAPATNIEFTVTMLAGEHCDDGDRAESVTLYE